MANRTCVIDGCDRKNFARGWCRAHYNRWQRHGDPGSAQVQRRNPGASCAVDGCERLLGKSGSHGYCYKHAYRYRMNGDPLVTRSTAGPKGERNAAWRGDDVEYAAVHRRLAVYRGRAAEHSCVRCGDRADGWAYQHTAPDERISEKVGLPFTTDLAHYEPMCNPCHHQLDALHGWSTPVRVARGVSQDRKSGRWRAYATLSGKQYSAGRHDTREQAESAAFDLRVRLLEDYEVAPA